MSFFKKIFGGTTESTAQKEANTKKETKKIDLSRSNFKFGRYTDRNKTDEQRSHWTKSQDAFKNKKYLDAHIELMQYVKDDNVKNLTYKVNGDTMTFEFIQGSNIVRGFSNNEKFEAVSQIALMETPSIPVMRKLMTMNYGLKYSKFGLLDNIICMKFTSLLVDSSPNKIYYGLQELARKADQQDDLLISEFSSIKEVESETTIKVDEEKQAKQIKYLKKWISETTEEINKLDKNKFQGGIAFLLLSLTYKIDYLLTPHGKLMESLEKIHRIFFIQSNETTQQRNDKIIEVFTEINRWSDDQLKEGLYDTVSTYSLVNPANHKTVMDMVFDEMKKADWYIQNNYPKVTQSVFEYSISYAFFTYGMFYPTMQIFDLLMNIFNDDFYKEMGVDNSFISANGTLNATAISGKLVSIINNSKSEFPKIDFRVNNIKYESKIVLFKTIMTEADYLNYGV